MPHSEITRHLKHGILLVAGLLLFVPATASAAPAGAHGHPEKAVNWNADTRGIDGIPRTYLRLAKVIVLKNELREAPDINDGLHQPVAPRLQSRIKKNSEFAAFVKLVRATSKRKYTAEELRKLYLSFKAWSYHNSTMGQ